ncbi:thiamine phosphate synthase [Putridiphycobacter roseus]|uniref:Thiamine-phosphate synthase n=1 Tax=Putridiphycobacter roseus TaxID=2219161 RepID=A0A2W1NSA4_9FLAO|nr:thiamine phosphate synthase [Putridiphycobacter roseus]PZE17548.1 thiamine phosphate synthase [Putridiphycobacter roseus]
MIKIDYSLMFVTDDRIGDDTAFFSILESALKGGATIIQLREKTLDTLHFYLRAVKAKTLCDTYKVPLIINDRVDIALAVAAAGLHIGENDLPKEVVRKLMGPNKIIGSSVSNKQQAITAQLSDVDYIGISPVFSTSSKIENLASPLGINGLVEIRKIFTNPIVCIGGINKDNTGKVMLNGANGIAVISAISKAESPTAATKQLKEIICQTGLNK